MRRTVEYDLNYLVFYILRKLETAWLDWRIPPGDFLGRRSVRRPNEALFRARSQFRRELFAEVGIVRIRGDTGILVKRTCAKQFSSHPLTGQILAKVLGVNPATLWNWRKRDSAQCLH